MPRLTSVLALAALALTAALADAKMRMMPMDERVKGADVILVAKVKKISDVKINDGDYKKLELDASSVLKGKADLAVTILVPAGARRIVLPEVGTESIYFLASGADATYKLAPEVTAFSIANVADIDEVKKAIAAEKPPATKP